MTTVFTLLAAAAIAAQTPNTMGIWSQAKAVVTPESLLTELRARTRAEDVAIWDRVNAAVIADSLRRLSETRWYQPKGETLVAIAAALGGWVFAIIQLRAQQKQERRALLYASLEKFSGQTQNRAIGLAIVEANWTEWPDLHATWVGVLVNQAVHLLTGSKEHESQTERANLERAVRILNQGKGLLGPHEKLALDQALTTALDSSPTARVEAECISRVGVYVECATLRKWRSDL